jgi:hypothetical protein
VISCKLPISFFEIGGKLDEVTEVNARSIQLYPNPRLAILVDFRGRVCRHLYSFEVYFLVLWSCQNTLATGHVFKVIGGDVRYT